MNDPCGKVSARSHRARTQLSVFSPSLSRLQPQPVSIIALDVDRVVWWLLRTFAALLESSAQIRSQDVARALRVVQCGESGQGSIATLPM